MFAQTAMLFTLAPAAVLIAGLSKGGFGSGAAFLATPLLALALPPAQAVAVMLPLLLLMDVTGLRAFRGRWSREHALPLMAGAIPGLLIGGLVFGYVDADAVRVMLGVLALAFGGIQLAQSRGWRPMGDGKRRGGLIWGAVAGFTSFISHAGGPPVTIHLMGARLDKTTFQATTVLVFWWINLMKVAPYAALGLFDAETLRLSLMLAPLAVIGMVLGVAGHRYVPEWIFFMLVRVLLVAAGIKLIWDGASGLMA